MENHTQLILGGKNMIIYGDNPSPAMKQILSNAKQAYFTMNKEFINYIPEFDVVSKYAFSIAEKIGTINSWEMFFQSIQNLKEVADDILSFENCENRILQRTKKLFVDINSTMDEKYKEHKYEMLNPIFRFCTQIYDKVLPVFMAGQELLSDIIGGWEDTEKEFRGLYAFVCSLLIIICVLSCCKLCESVANTWNGNVEDAVRDYVDEHFEKYGWYHLITMAKNTLEDCRFQCRKSLSDVLISQNVFALTIYFYKYPIISE